MKNNSFKEIAQALKTAQTILLFPHINADGDAIGSGVALCKALRLLGKDCYILMCESVPENFRFTDTHRDKDESYFTDNLNIFDHIDVAMCVDCGELNRFPDREDVFNRGRVKICLDHHDTSKGIFDLNYIDSNASATGILAFHLIKELGIIGDKEIGEAIFLAITTDTGNFQYSNTNKECHEVMAKLYDWGIDANKVSVAIYENVRWEKYMVQACAMENCRLIMRNGDEAKENSKLMGALAFIDMDTLDKLGALPEETDDIVESLRSIKDVEIAVFLKEKENNVIRVSMRAKTEANVAEIAKKHGGGGHVKAAGCTLYMALEEAVSVMTEAVKEALNKL